MKSTLTIQFDSAQEMGEFIAGLNPVITIVPPVVKIEPAFSPTVVNPIPETVTTGGPEPTWGIDAHNKILSDCKREDEYFNIKKAREPETVVIPEHIFEPHQEPKFNKVRKSLFANLPPKSCVTCHKEFVPYHNRVVWCPECKQRQIDNKASKKAKYHKDRPA